MELSSFLTEFNTLLLAALGLAGVAAFSISVLRKRGHFGRTERGTFYFLDRKGNMLLFDENQNIPLSHSARAASSRISASTNSSTRS